MNPNFKPEALNEFNKIKLNISSNIHTNNRLKADNDNIQNLNIEFIEKLNKNEEKSDNEVLTKMNKFREYMRKQKEYLENTKKNNEMINNIQSSQIKESNLRQNLADNIKYSDRKNKAKGMNMNLKL